MRRNVWPIWMAIILVGIFTTGGAGSSTVPAFDNSVSISSSVVNMQTGALESSLRSSLVGVDGSAPGVVHYSFSISGVNGSAYGGAVGTAKTEFVISSLEGRDTLLNISSERTWKDSTEVTGTIVNFRKNFDYTSGIRL